MYVVISSDNGVIDSLAYNPFANTPYMNGEPFCDDYPESENPDFDYECEYTMSDTIKIFNDTTVIIHVGE